MSLTHHRDVLPGGLRVVTVETPHLHTALLAVFVRAGSRHEHPGNNGVSHFLEHLFFRGSRRFPDSVAMNARVEAVGGNLNGVTARDHGFYDTPLHPDHLPLAFEVLGDMLCAPRLVDLDVEREVILEEMLDEVDEKGRDVDVDNLAKRLVFGAHPLGLKIAGTRESVRALGHEQVLAHYARHYVRGNVVVCAAGRVRREEVLELAHRHFAALPEGPAVAERAPRLARPGPRLQHVLHEESQFDVQLTFGAVHETHPDAPAVQLLRRLLDDGLSSRLPYEVVEKRGLAYSIHAAYEPYHDTGLFLVEGAASPEKVARVVQEVFHVLGRLCEAPVGDEELARAKRRYRLLLDFAQDAPGELAGYFGGTELFREPEPFAERARRVDAVDARALQRVARRLFARDNVTCVAVGPRKGVRALERVVHAAEGLPGGRPAAER